jgi:hypothetical protein
MSEAAPTATQEPSPTAIVTVVEPALLEIKKKNELSAETFDQLSEAYRPFFTEVHELLEQAKRVEVKDATEVTMIRHARELRLKLREQRVAADKLREQLKVDSNRRGNAIQSFFNLLKFKVEPIEEKLLAAEQFAERAEQKRMDELGKKRAEELRPYTDPTVYAIMLPGMAEDQYRRLFEGLKSAHEAAEAKKKKDEEERIAKEKADAEERERVRLENERLRKEAAEREAAAKAERERLAKEKKDAEDRAAAAEKEAQRQREDADKRHREEIAKKEREAVERTERELEAQRKRNAEIAAQIKKETDQAIAEQKRIAQESAAKAAAALKRAEAEAAKAREIEADRLAVANKVKEEEAARVAALAAAPDKEKLAVLASQIRALELPELATDRAKEVAKLFRAQREKFAVWVTKQADTLTSEQSTLSV